jgi:hypothetical protein
MGNFIDTNTVRVKGTGKVKGKVKIRGKGKSDKFFYD